MAGRAAAIAGERRRREFSRRWAIEVHQFVQRKVLYLALLAYVFRLDGARGRIGVFVYILSFALAIDRRRGVASGRLGTRFAILAFFSVAAHAFAALLLFEHDYLGL